MAIENFDEVKTYFETNKDNDEVKTFVGGLNPITTDKVKSLVDTDKDLKSWLDSEKDKHSGKSLETWKTNNLQKLIDDAVKKANPAETPEQKQIRELTDRLNKKETEEKKGQLTNKALKVAQEKKLPTSLVDFFIGEDEDTTTKNLEALEKVFTETVNKMVTERLDGDYKPPKGDKKPVTTEEQAKTEVFKLFGL
jgi:hypothetical protein